MSGPLLREHVEAADCAAQRWTPERIQARERELLLSLEHCIRQRMGTYSLEIALYELDWFRGLALARVLAAWFPAS